MRTRQAKQAGAAPATSAGRATLRVGELAAAVGVSGDTVRYYERIGLLPAPARTGGGYRAYAASAVDRIRFVQGAQRLGLTLTDIKNLLAVRDTGVCPCEPAEQLLRRRLAEVDAELARLNALRAEMLAMVSRLPGPDCPAPAPGTWCPPPAPASELPAPKGGDHMICDDDCTDDTCCPTGCC